ncbi:hypothetical protein PR048_015517 [Dryococelus australis]|uniref:Reverse transcriptase domain-containing protein n=1 Tax=Dryococelus australis TaxID=614101 RepID=A0ABQ9HH49_9NEOP|nr:hypothetical protein PR048_015517 [Dryococelus australis]
MKERDAARKNYWASKLPHYFTPYKELHYTLASMIRKSKMEFFNGLTNTHRMDKDIPDSLKLPNKINNYFISFSKAADLTPSANNEIDSEVIAATEEFSFVKTFTSEIYKSISNLKTLALGVDKIEINMIKLCTPYCIPVIKHIINHSFQSYTFPTTWKQSKIIPLGKVSHPTEFKHLRPISILPVMSKIIERIVHTRLSNYLNANKLLYNRQDSDLLQTC